MLRLHARPNRRQSSAGRSPSPRVSLRALRASSSRSDDGLRLDRPLEQRADAISVADHTLRKSDGLVDELCARGLVLAHVDEDRALRPRGHERLDDALDPDERPAPATPSIVCDRLERVDPIGPLRTCQSRGRPSAESRQSREIIAAKPSQVESRMPGSKHLGGRKEMAMTRHERIAGLVFSRCASPCGCAACGGGSRRRPLSRAGRGSGTISTAATDLGDILVDDKGMTLYLFEKDTSGTNTCDAACASAWPPLAVTGSPTPGGGVDETKLATVSRPDGSLQVTYNGHPLYLFSGDTKPGDTSGEATQAFGAEWYAVSGSGDPVEKKSAGGGYGGY